MEIGARRRSAGYYTRDDFLDVCEWKTRRRPRRHSPLSLDSRLVLNSFSPLVFHAGAPIYIPVAKLGFQQRP
jgi:hypothetical protein